MHDSSKQLYLAIGFLIASYITSYMYGFLLICNISAVVMIATVNTTAITITLAIAIYK